MKIHFLKENALTALKTNLNANVLHYADKSNKWIYDYFGDEKPFLEYRNPVDDFTLNIHEGISLAQSDVLNAITLYRAMKDLSDTQATDERLWAGLCHEDFWEYLNERWNIEDLKKIKNTEIQTRYFFAHNKRRSLITNTLSRLWWLGRLTYDSERENPFELIHYFDNDFSTKVLIIFSNNFMGSPNVSIGMISALNKLEKDGFLINGRAKREVYYEASKYLNVLGGTCILDYYSKKEIETKLISHLKNI